MKSLDEGAHIGNKCSTATIEFFTCSLTNSPYWDPPHPKRYPTSLKMSDNFGVT